MVHIHHAIIGTTDSPTTMELFHPMKSGSRLGGIRVGSRSSFWGSRFCSKCTHCPGEIFTPVVRANDNKMEVKYWQHWQLENLFTWKYSYRDYSFRVFINGDYQFLCLLYGLSGASGKIKSLHMQRTTLYLSTGRHCCLWCLVPSSDLQRCTFYQRRTLAGIEQDHARFLAAGGDIRRAKHFNNVIHRPIFNIELDQVSKCWKH